ACLRQRQELRNMRGEPFGSMGLLFEESIRTESTNKFPISILAPRDERLPLQLSKNDVGRRSLESRLPRHRRDGGFTGPQQRQVDAALLFAHSQILEHRF